MQHITPKIWKFTVELLFPRYFFSNIHKYYDIRIQSRTGNSTLSILTYPSVLNLMGSSL